MVSEGAQGGLSCLFQILVALGIPWLVATSRQCPSVFTWLLRFSPYVCLLWVSLTRTSLSEDGGSAQLAQDDLTLRSLVTFTKTLFSSNVTFTGPRAYSRDVSFC